MGMNTSLYVGVVIKCMTPKQKEIKKTKRYCDECGHGKKKGLNDGAKFCPCCGHEIYTETITKKKELDFYEITEQSGIDEDEFFLIDPEYTKNAHYLGFNRWGKSHWDIDNDDFVTYNLTPDKIQTLLDKGREKYGETVKKLAPYYESVNIEFVVKTNYG